MSGFFDNLPDEHPVADQGALDALINADKGEVRTAARYNRDTTTAFLEKCPGCKGSGSFYSYTGRLVGPCFKCKGAGNLTFKTSPEERMARRQDEAAKRNETQDEWATEHWDVLNWCGKQTRSDFAASLLNSYAKYHRLTENQVAAVRRSIARDAQKAADDAACAIAEKPAVDATGVADLKAAFDKAIKFAQEKCLTMRHPRIVVNGLRISPAKADSTNPGAIYVKLGDAYMGKIIDNRFHAARECKPEDEARILAFIADPKKAAEAYGQTTGICCVCNATLKSKWKLKGIGPVCAQKYGWA